MERKLSIPIYAGAFVISLAIFILGIYIGSLIDSSNLRDMSEEVSAITARMTAVQVLLLSGGNVSFCPLYTSELDAIDDDVEDVGYKLSFMEDERGAFDNDLKRKYFILEAESYLLSQRMKTLCGDDSVLLINFYSNKACERCKEQGTEVLKARDALRSQNMTMKLFSFDGELDSPVAEAFEAQYNITKYPSIVIDDQVYSGFRSSDELQSIVKGSR
jgi:hypothetical protein